MGSDHGYYLERGLLKSPPKGAYSAIIASKILSILYAVGTRKRDSKSAGRLSARQIFVQNN